MNRLRSWLKFLPPLLLVCSLFAVYWSTLAPGLTWAHDGSDGGDLITAAATRGVPHPTGYPLYLVLARLFQLVPWGSLAFRTNLLSAVATASTAALVYVLVATASTDSKGTHHWPAGLAAGFAFGLAPVIWSQAVITEVYALHVMLAALILILFTRPRPVSTSSQKHLAPWRGLTLGLAMGNHISTIFLLPAAFLLGSLKEKPAAQGSLGLRHSWFSTIKFDRVSLARQIAMFAVGLLIYLLIPFRALANPPVNWGYAVTLERFWWLVSGQLYRDHYLQFSLVDVWARLQAAAAILLDQFGMPGVILGLVGLILFGKPSRFFLLTTWIAFVFTALAVVYGADDSYVYLMPVFLSFALWIGLGIIGLSNQFPQWSSLLRIGLPLLFVGYLVTRSAMQISRLDASRDLRAEIFGREVLSSVPENAILFAKGDEAVFTLWYFHFTLKERQDISVLAEDLLHFDWYQENLRATYPGLMIPGPFPWPQDIALANPARGICYVRYADRAEIECSQPVDLDETK